MTKIILSESHADIQHWVFPEIDQVGLAPLPEKIPAPIGNKVVNLPIIEEELAAARAKGYQEGFAEGKAHGAEELKQTLNASLQQEWQARQTELSAFMERLQPAVEENTEEIEKRLVELSFKVARWLVGQEISQKPELIMGIIRKVLGEVPVLQPTARLYVNPVDHVLVRMVLGERYAELIHDDPELARGESRLVCNGGEIDATFDARLQFLAEQVMGNESHG